jgi:hypothetical protein
MVLFSLFLSFSAKRSIFISLLFEIFNSNQNDKKRTLSKIIISDNKPEIRGVLFDLGCCRYEIDEMNALEVKIDHWYRH